MAHQKDTNQKNTFSAKGVGWNEPFQELSSYCEAFNLPCIELFVTENQKEVNAHIMRMLTTKKKHSSFFEENFVRALSFLAK